MVTVKRPSGPSIAALTKFEEVFAKQFPSANLRRTSVIEKYEVIPTGSIALDCALGVGGYVEGRLVEDWGPDGTGKTTRALIACAQAQKKHPGKMAAFIDMEAKLDLDWAVKLRVDLERMYHVQPDSAEELADIVKSMVQSDLVSILVIDSIGSMVNEEEQEKDANQRSVGTTPGIITRMVKIAASEAKKNGTVVYMINQVRANLGYGADTTTGGGFARAHATTHRLKSRLDGGQSSLVIGSGNNQVQVGVKLAIKIEKNGVAPPKRTAMVTLITSPTEKFGMTIGFGDQATEAMNVGKLYGVIPRAGSMYTLPDGEVVKGADAAEARLRENPALIEEVRRLALASIASTVTQTELEEG
jgi:recombination protein RecA